MKCARTLLAVAMMLFASGPAFSVDAPLTVVELFTSQGCSSCPPADKYLSELAATRESNGVLALSFHVDYWDYLGWKDPYSSSRNTQRQRDYARKMDLRYVYTPQMVIQGAHQTTGSNRVAVASQIAKARRMIRVPIELKRSGQTLSITLPDATGTPEADIFIVVYDNTHTTAVKRGENRGETITNRNVVRSITNIGQWRGESSTLTASVPDKNDGDACAVIIQTKNRGAILGAATMALN
ncbi:MAG: DUF1223 domain-containing protein [Rhodospirillaceae bacterium]|jgi:hypothetical protein|nr:DUF1223 domain-containing protein [Rhodospirillaceae bacterium]MBT5014457.1 DUF1223 domain-containing protein [Rhodospirillaceae bacterium]MBT5307957.1 DUF1223 domain-containing protein [Rhodospirillaceae bacterium]MBT6406391.1 DUF1223 domain-containing protein [Rhodospirillaceae bacterium]MBT7355302.1 DUF1223 domain-containing protein [Rhodospirillaceae bacterium]